MCIIILSSLTSKWLLSIYHGPPDSEYNHNRSTTTNFSSPSLPATYTNLPEAAHKECLYPILYSSHPVKLVGVNPVYASHFPVEGLDQWETRLPSQILHG